MTPDMIPINPNDRKQRDRHLEGDFERIICFILFQFKIFWVTESNFELR